MKAWVVSVIAFGANRCLVVYVSICVALPFHTEGEWLYVYMCVVREISEPQYHCVWRLPVLITWTRRIGCSKGFIWGQNIPRFFFWGDVDVPRFWLRSGNVTQLKVRPPGCSVMYRAQSTWSSLAFFWSPWGAQSFYIRYVGCSRHYYEVTRFHLGLLFTHCLDTGSMVSILCVLSLSVIHGAFTIKCYIMEKKSWFLGIAKVSWHRTWKQYSRKIRWAAELCDYLIYFNFERDTTQVRLNFSQCCIGSERCDKNMQYKVS